MNGRKMSDRMCKRGKQMIKLQKKCGLYIVSFIVMLLSVLQGNTFSVFANPADENQTIRVGYFAFEGYHNIDADGNRSGYGYEYLQQLARYTGWRYEYVGYDKSWNDAQKMLENGEIDLLTSAQKTEEREKKFDFSEDPIGYSSTILPSRRAMRNIRLIISRPLMEFALE